jgi:hypothetical protein
MRELAEAEHEKANLARAIAKRGDLDALLVALDDATKRAATIRDRVALLDSEPQRLDPRRSLARIEAKLPKLGENVDARAVLAAALQGRRLTATPVEIKGQRHWQLSAKIGAGYLLALANSGAPSSYWLLTVTEGKPARALTSALTRERAPGTVGRLAAAA